MSQFRKTGNFYVSEWNGDPLNPGTAELPFKNYTDAGGSGIYIIGPGHYNVNPLSKIATLEGDGKVVIRFLANPTSLSDVRNLTLDNFGRINWSTTNFTRFSDCIVISNLNPEIPSRNTNNATEVTHYRNIYVTDWRSLGNSPSGTHNEFNSIFLGIMTMQSNIGFIRFSCNFVEKNASIWFNISAAPGNVLITNNCINGLIKIVGDSNDYECKKLFDGSSRTDADPTRLDIADVMPDFYSWGNFSGNPKFIDVFSRTVEPDSDLLKKSNANGFIGGVKPGQYINFSNSDFVITFQNIDTSNPDLLKIADGFDFGKIRITGKISDTLISSQAVDIRIPIFFDSSEPGGDPLNNNVPDAVHGLRGLDTLGDLPYRLRFEVRSSQMPNANRFNNDEWDNDISGIAGRWYLMEYGQPMLHHIVASVAYGNADKFAINAPVKTPFNYRSLDIEITLSNDRSQV